MQVIKENTQLPPCVVVTTCKLKGCQRMYVISKERMSSACYHKEAGTAKVCDDGF